MKDDKAYIVRKVLVIVTLIMIVSTLGLFMVTTQINTISLDYYGTKITVKTLASNVQDFLIENNIVISDEDIVCPAVNAELTEGSKIKISSSKEYATIDITEKLSGYKPEVAKIEEVIETVPYGEETVNNSTVARGTTKTLEEGADGQRSTKYLVKYIGDVEVERAQISSEIIVEAKNKVIEVGTKLPTLASRSKIVERAAAHVPTAEEGFRVYNISLPVEQQQFAFNICKEYGIQYELFLAMMFKESSYRSNAVGVNSYGLCQIYVTNFSMLTSRLGVSNFLDPYDNMTAGAYILSIYFNTARKYVSGNDVEVYALNAYNMGDGAFYSQCYSKGVLHRSYSTTIINMRNNLLSKGSLY